MSADVLMLLIGTIPVGVVLWWEFLRRPEPRLEVITVVIVISWGITALFGGLLGRVG